MLKTSHNLKIGALGEAVVAHGLQRRGFKVLDRNVRTKFGEIDLIVEKNSRVVFVEVKTRLTRRLGYPEEAITLYKRNNLSRSVLALLEHYCKNKNWAVLIVGVDLDLSKKTARLHAVELDD